MAFKPIPLNLPAYPFKLTERNGVLFIFDEVRKKHLFLSPEEWVRQHFVQFLITEKKVPKMLIQLEGGLKLHELQKRSDILIFSREGNKLMLVECKAAHVTLNQSVFDQAARYNLVHQASWLAITNGKEHFYVRIDRLSGDFRYYGELPDYETLCSV